MICSIASGPAIWQRTIDQALQDIPNIQCLLDDVCITGCNNQEHLNNIEIVLSKLSEFALKIKTNENL